MSEDQTPPGRRPFGERDDAERGRPFGGQPFGPRQGRATPRPPAQAGPEPVALDESPAPPAPAEPDALPVEDRPIRVPLVRVRAEDVVRTPAEAPAGGEEPAAADVPHPAEVMLRDEPNGAPALIRVRDRRGKVPAEDSILKTRSVYDEPDEKARGLPALRFGVMLRAFLAMFLAAGIVATMFTWWTPNSFLPSESMSQLSVALATQDRSGAAAPTALPTVTTAPPSSAAVETGLTNIGIVAGHRGMHPSTGQPDPGAVCADGLTEAGINESVALLVVEWLSQYGYQVDLLDEFDQRLQGYQALAVISIHADSCEYINDIATGFKVASFSQSTVPEQDARLVQCLVSRYAETTGLSFHPSVTFDMTEYHNFREVAPGTPGAIVEVGFMYLDRELLTGSPEVVALGVARGILCYLRDEPVDTTSVPPTTDTPVP